MTNGSRADRASARPNVAVVVPMPPRPELSADEAVSLRHLHYYLSSYDKYLLAPRGEPIEWPGFVTRRLPRKFFGSLAAHNNLLFWPGLYRAFRRYEYILFYHLDSLVLTDDLARWCAAGLDYIGPPWMPGPDTPWVQEPAVGNGGFALLRVEAARRVLRARYRREPASYVADLLARNGTRLAPAYALLRRLQRRWPRARVVTRLLAHRAMSDDPAPHGLNNDEFWSRRAAAYLPSFRVGTVEQALQFAFEASPRRCLELNGGRLPFGCHAWPKFDRAFWTPYLLP